MSEFDFRFRAGEEEDLPEFGAFPDGKHLVKISNVELRDTQKGGKRLVLNLQALEGNLEGLTTFIGLNVMCPGSPKAEAISRSQLKKLSQAIGRPDWDDIRVLKGEEVIAHLKLKPAKKDPYEDKEYPPSNEVRGFYPIEEEQIPDAPAGDDIPFTAEPTAPQAPSIPNDLPKTEERVGDPQADLPWHNK